MWREGVYFGVINVLAIYAYFGKSRVQQIQRILCLPSHLPKVHPVWSPVSKSVGKKEQSCAPTHAAFQLCFLAKT